MELIRLALSACFGAESGEETCCLCEVIRINSGYLDRNGFSSAYCALSNWIKYATDLIKPQVATANLAGVMTRLDVILDQSNNKYSASTDALPLVAE